MTDTPRRAALARDVEILRLKHEDHPGSQEDDSAGDGNKPQGDKPSGGGGGGGSGSSSSSGNAGVGRGHGIPFTEVDFEDSPGGNRSTFEKSLDTGRTYMAADGLGPSGLKAKIQQDLHNKLKDDPAWKAYIQERRDVGGVKTAEQMSLDSVRHFVSEWAASSGDHHAASIVMQHIAAKEFGLDDAKTEHFGMDYRTALSKVSTVIGLSGGATSISKDKTEAGIRAFIRAQYTATQESLKSRGIKSLYLVRGVRDVKATRSAVRSAKLQPLSSFSADPNIAVAFGSSPGARLLVAHVPRERIFSSPRTGFGCLNEHEYVLIGGGRLNTISIPYAKLKGKSVNSAIRKESIKAIQSKRDKPPRKPKEPKFADALAYWAAYFTRKAEFRRLNKDERQ